MNGKIQLKLLKTKRINTKNDLLLYANNYKTVTSSPNKKTIPMTSGYFPKDFSLNIYKSTSLYRKRYQIETIPLKTQLKKINIQKQSKKSEKIIKNIKMNIVKQNFSSDLLRLLKSNKIDRFFKRYLEKTKNIKIDMNIPENNRIERILTPTMNKKAEKKLIDEDKIADEDIIKQSIFIPLNNIKIVENKKISKDDIIQINSENNIKNNMINSGIQTGDVNQKEENKMKEKKDNVINRPQSHSILKNDYINDSITSFNNSRKNIGINTQRKLKRLKYTKKYLFLDKNQNVRVFTPIERNPISNDKIINNFETKNKLVFSFYDPNDRHIKILQKFENKIKYRDSKEQINNFSFNFY